MSLIIFHRSFNKANVMCLINKGRLLNSKYNTVAVSTLCPRYLLPASSFQQITAKPFSESAVKQSADAKGHDHVRHWVLEKVISAGMLGLLPAAFIFPHPSLDYLLSLVLVAHVHWGTEAIVVDYIRAAVFGQTIPKLSVAGLYFLSAFALGGLFYFNYTDVGLVKAIKMLWAL